MLNKCQYIAIIFLLCKLSFAQEIYIYNLQVSIDTILNTNYFQQSGVCQKSSYKAFVSDSISTSEIAISLKQHSITSDKLPNEDSLKTDQLKKPIDINNMKVHLKAELNYLFYWNKEYIYSFVYEKIDTITNLEGRNLLIDDTVFNNFKDYICSSEFCVCQPNEKYTTTLLIDSFSFSKDLNNYIDYRSIGEGIYWIFNRSDSDPHFLIVDQDGNKLLINPIKYWIHMNALKASSFKKKSYGYGLIFENYKEIYDNRPLIKYLHENLFYLIAEGTSYNAIKKSRKWKKLLDFHAFGNFKCMLPNTFIPSKNIFIVPEISGYAKEKLEEGPFPLLNPNDTALSIQSIGSLRLPPFQLLKKIGCTAVFSIHVREIERYYPHLKWRSDFKNELIPSNSVNNLKYLPGIYFLPDYLKVESINGLSQEEFIKNQCKN